MGPPALARKKLEKKCAVLGLSEGWANQRRDMVDEKWSWPEQWAWDKSRPCGWLVIAEPHLAHQPHLTGSLDLNASRRAVQRVSPINPTISGRTFSTQNISKFLFKIETVQIFYCLIQSFYNMSLATLHPPRADKTPAPSPLPALLQTPSGLAILELQGTINLPSKPDGTRIENVEVGRLHFPDYVPDAEGSAWMKRAHLYVGEHQRLQGEVKKLPKALAVVRRRERSGAGDDEQLEVVEIVKYKLQFSNRPEPVGAQNGV